MREIGRVREGRERKVGREGLIYILGKIIHTLFIWGKGHILRVYLLPGFCWHLVYISDSIGI